MTIPATQGQARGCAQRDKMSRTMWTNRQTEFMISDLLHLFCSITLISIDYFVNQLFAELAAAVEIPVDALLIPISTAPSNNIISFHIFFIY